MHGESNQRENIFSNAALQARQFYSRINPEDSSVYDRNSPFTRITAHYGRIDASPLETHRSLLSQKYNTLPAKRRHTLPYFASSHKNTLLVESTTHQSNTGLSAAMNRTPGSTTQSNSLDQSPPHWKQHVVLSPRTAPRASSMCNSLADMSAHAHARTTHSQSPRRPSLLLPPLPPRRSSTSSPAGEVLSALSPLSSRMHFSHLGASGNRLSQLSASTRGRIQSPRFDAPHSTDRAPPHTHCSPHAKQSSSHVKRSSKKRIITFDHHSTTDASLHMEVTRRRDSRDYVLNEITRFEARRRKA
uniref:Uncharacterized protein n=1 Tax=Percolomonas cosmopolitus TaxID=63605 RepID=A0A7S1PHR4_9EUKA|mmetsp:Transcript_9011/g.33226  ORF Transcript_9011/g.33226 Transcript_9011/m.33226 type:complete len:302 (+) Transcript_9011:66-971(+)